MRQVSEHCAGNVRVRLHAEQEETRFDARLLGREHVDDFIVHRHILVDIPFLTKLRIRTRVEGEGTAVGWERGEHRKGEGERRLEIRPDLVSPIDT